MEEFRTLLGPLPSPGDSFTWLLAAALLFSRALDFLSTWIVTPGLELEANPLMRRWRWGPMALLNLSLLALPFVHHGLAIALVVTSLLVAGTNLCNGALARGMGEKRQLESQRAALRRVGLAGALLMNSVGSLVVCLGGVFMAWLAPAPETRPWWAAMGVVMFGLVGLVHVNLGILRLHKTGGKKNGRPGGA